MGLIAIAFGGYALFEARQPASLTAPECRLFPQAAAYEGHRNARFGRGLHATLVPILYADGETPVRIALDGHEILNQVLPEEDSAGISAILRCGLSGRVRVAVSAGAWREQRDVVVHSDETVILVEVGRNLSATEEPLLLD